MAEWTSSRSYSQRVQNLRGTGSGPAFASRLNGNAYLRGDGPAATVFDDGQRDSLTGLAGTDWFFADLDNADPSKRDLILALAAGESRDDID